MHFIAGFLLAILLSSCATTTNNYYTKTVDGWRGGNIKTLVKRWGAPYNKITYPSGDSVYLYKTESYKAYGATPSPQIGVHVAGGKPVIITQPSMNNGSNRGMSINCVTAFFVNKAGIITDTKTKGSSCYGGENFANTMGNLP